MNLNLAYATNFEKTVLFIAFSLTAFAIYYYWHNSNAKKKKALQTEFDDIINSDKYKVKGKFESDR